MVKFRYDGGADAESQAVTKATQSGKLARADSAGFARAARAVSWNVLRPEINHCLVHDTINKAAQSPCTVQGSGRRASTERVHGVSLGFPQTGRTGAML